MCVLVSSLLFSFPFTVSPVMEDPNSIDSRYKAAHKLLLETRDQLSKLESGKDSSVILQGTFLGSIVIVLLMRLHSQAVSQLR